MPSQAQTAYEKAEGREGAIRQLVMDHLPLVRRIVNRVCAGLELPVSEEDLISAGTLGLVEAAHRFDASVGVKFMTFAYARVRGAVVDCLRADDRLGRLARERLSALRRCIAEFRRAHGCKPTVEEMAERLGISPDEVLKGLSYEKWDCVGSLQDSITEPDGECIALAELLPASTQDPFDALEWKERAEGLARAIEELPEREKQIIVMYYYEELYISEMAEVLGVSESRVSQLHTRALYNLTRKLEGEQWQTR